MTDLRTHFDPTPGTGPLMAQCIYHDDSTASLAIYADHVYCFGCTTYAWSPAFLHDLEDRGDPPLVTSRTAQRVDTKPRYLPFSMVSTYTTWLFESPFQDRLAWLYARGLRRDVLSANWIGHCGDAFTIPVFDANKKVLAIRYRRDPELSPEGSKYWGTAGANGVLLYEPKTPQFQHVSVRHPETLFVTEGELDALRLAQEGYRAVSLTNGARAMREEHAQALAGMSRRIALVYDQDLAGQEGSRKALRLLSEAGVEDLYRVSWPEPLGKDITDFLLRWPLEAFERRVVWSS